MSSSKDGADGGISVGAIVGIVIAAVLVVCILVACFSRYQWRRKKDLVIRRHTLERAAMGAGPGGMQGVPCWISVTPPAHPTGLQSLCQLGPNCPSST